jgi:hypothetical protein
LAKSIQFAGTAMCRIRLLLMVMAVMAFGWSNCQAAGSFQTRAAFSNVVSASYSHPQPSVSVAHANIPTIDFGCGRGRVRDAQTHGCRGPADIK